MKLLDYELALVDFTLLDRQINKLREIRDSYLAANVRIYGEHLAQPVDGDEL